MPLAEFIQRALEDLSPEIADNVTRRGIVLTGGGALLRDLDRLISEETGLHVRLLGLCGVIDRVVRDSDVVRYHYVIIDYVAESVGGHLEAGTDAAEVRWVAVGDLDQYDCTEGLADMIRRAIAIHRAGFAG